MSSPVDQDQKWLIECLTATLDTSREVRSFAEASLQQASLQPGSLLMAFELRIIHHLLLPTLDDPNRKIRTAISMAIVSIAEYDWPDDWPELLPFLLKLISAQNNISGVILPSLWQTFVSSLDAYQISSVHGTEDLHSGRFDSDGNERSLDAFVIQSIPFPLSPLTHISIMSLRATDRIELLAIPAKLDRRIAHREARLGHVDAQLDLKLDGLRMSRDSLVVFLSPPPPK
ncbi:hypothetical protein KSP40_PGU003866 [Platanthera guangdongensis]|uniref:Exportin-1/Importin-beta-like domain-containing protein n=1 Tax=Platanthera guangdongensis TaxID=2320717 RepID=A0ABR2N0T7_9ASPA